MGYLGTLEGQFPEDWKTEEWAIFSSLMLLIKYSQISINESNIKLGCNCYIFFNFKSKCPPPFHLSKTINFELSSWSKLIMISYIYFIDNVDS